ncbi:Uncharacterised protein [Klebsiella michiganensis]|uniref:Uncharacterized protein n=1 Tax=Klebsiella michiganensis TaxID=1134687 RepID=A0A7H4MZP6_9ENTR|nr:Uncharacterised protein [Klebsiella michiganensis]
MRYALRVMYRQAVFQEVLDRTFNRRLVARPCSLKSRVDTLTQFVNAFPLIHFRLLQPLRYRLAGLGDRLLIGINTLRGTSKNRIQLGHCGHLLHSDRFYAGGQQGLFKFVEENFQLSVADQQGRQQTQHAAVAAAALEDQTRFEAFLLQQRGEFAIPPGSSPCGPALRSV